MRNEEWLSETYEIYDRWKDWQSGEISAIDTALLDQEFRRAELKPGSCVLEIGFGTGSALLHLQSRNFDCWGIERRDSHNEVLSKRGINIVNGEMESLPDTYFDFIYAFDVLEHLDKAELIDLLKNVRRTLKPGGKFLARFPNCASPFGYMNQAADLTHISALSISSFAQACIVADLNHCGGWNSAVSWRGRGIIKTLMKPIILLLRRSIERLICAAFYGEYRPLDVNVTVCAERIR